MQCPRYPSLFNKFYLMAKRILGLVEFPVFRIAPWDEGVRDEGVRDGPGILPMD